jgi:glycosyltransferase involved in cell wall biosynthesis
VEIKNGENTSMKKISFIIPSRNNLPFLKQAYYSIRDNIGSEHEIVMLDDASEDGTWKWLYIRIKDLKD